MGLFSTYFFLILDTNGSAYKSVADFKNAVLSTTGANDLMKPSNTTGTSQFAPGDLLLLDTGVPGGTQDGRMSHVQVITDINYMALPGI